MIMFVIAVIAIVAIMQRWSEKNALLGIEYRQESTKKIVEPEESFQLVSTLTNRSNRFVPFLRVVEVFPAQAQVLHGQTRLRVDLMGNVKHHYSTYLMPKSRLERKISLTLPKRGTYYFRGAQIAGGDFLGLREERQNFSGTLEIVVYPKSAPLGHLHEALGGFMGDVSVRRFIMEDPILTVGVRDYTGREPLNQISWKHSARTNQLQVKQFDYTVEPMVSILLDANALDPTKAGDQLLESCYGLVRSVCEQLERKGISYDFMTNVLPENYRTKKEQYLGKGLGKNHLQKVLEILGRASYFSAEKLEDTVEKLILKQARNRSAIVVMPERDAAKEKIAHRLKERIGGSLICFYGEDCHDVYNRVEKDL